MNELDLRNELCEMFDTGWNLINWSTVQNSATPRVIYDGRDSLAPVDITLPYAKVFIEPLMSGQSSLTGATGLIKYKNLGLMTVQTFGVLDRGDGLEMAEYMAIMAKRIYQGKVSPNGVWFRNCRTNRIGTTGGWFQFNTLIEFEYDELR